MKASDLNHKKDYPDFPELKDLPLDRVSAALITTLQTVRDKTGIPIIPSPLKSGWARLDDKSEDSRHYAVNRLSDAGDIFPEKGRVLELWLRLQAVQNVGAVGLYADTTGPDGSPWPMVHFDLRESRQKVLWARDGDYFYLPQHSVDFWRAVNEIIQMEEKV